jgi:alkaline phosphatase D
MKRRDIIKGGVALSGIGLFGGRAPAIVGAPSARPVMPYGVMSGDLRADQAMIWAAVDRPARMRLEWSRDPDFRRVVRRSGPLAAPASGLTAKLDLDGLPPGGEIHYRVAFEAVDDPRAVSEWQTGRLRLPGHRRPLRFTFSGDEAGQGFGIDLARGGYRLYEAMRRMQPDFFIHQGDQIYADGPLKETVALPGGGEWRNVLTPTKTRIAADLDDFRGAFAYNLQDTSKRRFLADVPMLVQWDDHEVRNNWFADKPLASSPSMPQLAAWARQAMIEYNPMRIAPAASGIQRSFAMGPLLDVFLLDERSAKGPNLAAASAQPGAGLLDDAQLSWLKAALSRSKAVWKLIASDLPLSLTVPDLNKDVAPGGMEAIANGKAGRPGGREAQLAELLSFIKARGIANTVWISADVHYASAIHYHPERAAFRDFDPFWEIVAGPINAGTGNLTMNPLDPTFGPTVVHTTMPEAVEDTSPAAGNQFFGMGQIDDVTKQLTLSIHDLDGKSLWSHTLDAEDRGQPQ